MAIDLILPLSEVDALIGTAVDKFDNMKLYRASTRGGVYTLVTTILLVSGTRGYSFTDTTGLTSSWYKVTLYNSVTVFETDIAVAEPFPAARDITTRTQLRQYVIRKFGGEIYTPSAYATQSVTLPDVIDTGEDSDYFAGWHIFRPTAAATADTDRRAVSISGNVLTHGGRAYAGTAIGSEQVELCNLDLPLTVLNDTIGDGLLNTRYVSRYEFGAQSGVLQYSLPNFVEGPEYVVDAWIRFGATVASYRWEQMSSSGRWWKVRGSNFQCILDINPARSQNEVLALDTWRPGEKLDSESDFTVVQPLWAKAAAMVSVIEYLITRDLARHGKTEYGPMLDLWTKKLRQCSKKYGPTPGMRMQVPQPIGAFPEI
jgi:hypothetical protein